MVIEDPERPHKRSSYEKGTDSRYDPISGHSDYQCLSHNLTSYVGVLDLRSPLFESRVRVGLSENVRSHGWRSQAYTDVFTAFFGKPHPLPCLPPNQPGRDPRLGIR